METKNWEAFLSIKKEEVKLDLGLPGLIYIIRKSHDHGTFEEDNPY